MGHTQNEKNNKSFADNNKTPAKISKVPRFSHALLYSPHPSARCTKSLSAREGKKNFALRSLKTIIHQSRGRSLVYTCSWEREREKKRRLERHNVMTVMRAARAIHRECIYTIYTHTHRQKPRRHTYEALASLCPVFNVPAAVVRAA